MYASSATRARSAESGNRCAYVFDNCSRLVPIVAAISNVGSPAAIAQQLAPNENEHQELHADANMPGAGLDRT